MQYTHNIGQFKNNYKNRRALCIISKRHNVGNLMQVVRYQGDGKTMAGGMSS
jgi:hypothetical protein